MTQRWDHKNGVLFAEGQGSMSQQRIRYLIGSGDGSPHYISMISRFRGTKLLPQTVCHVKGRHADTAQVHASLKTKNPKKIVVNFVT